MKTNYPKQRYRLLISVELDLDADSTVKNTQIAVADAVTAYLQSNLTIQTTAGGYAFVVGSIDILGCEPVDGGPETGV